MIKGRYDTYYTISEFAEMAGVSPKTIMNWLSEGTVKAVRLGRRRFVPLSSIEEAFGQGKEQVSMLPKVIEEQINIVRKDVRGSNFKEG